MQGQLLVGSRKGLFIFSQANGGWKIDRTAFMGTPVSQVLYHRPTQHLFVALNSGHFGPKLHRSADAGATWTEVGTPAFPEGEVSNVRGTDKPATLKQVWCLEAGAGERELWAGGIPGGLFHSTDLGETWTLVRSLWDRPERKEWFGGGYDESGVHSICVSPKDRQQLTLGISCGSAWFSPDNGESWELRANGLRNEYMPPDQAYGGHLQDPHRLVQCPADPNVLWIQHHNGVFRSTDGGLNWTELTAAVPSVFGFAVVAHPTDPNRAWFVPAQKDEFRYPLDGKFVVSTTSDGGQTFKVLDSGLPPVPAYDLVYRHGLDIDDSGNRLAMGSTTGGLWSSDNQGQSWTTVSAHMPPVYVVRFA